MLIKITALYIKLFQIKCILSLGNKILSIIKSSSQDRLLDGIPGPSIISCLGRVPQASGDSGHGIRLVCPDIKEIIDPLVAGSGSRYAAGSAIGLLLEDHGSQNIGIHTGLGSCIHNDIHIALARRHRRRF